MVAGHLRIQNGIYQMILSYKDKQNKRKTKSISTHLPVKGNKKKAEAGTGRVSVIPEFVRREQELKVTGKLVEESFSFGLMLFSIGLCLTLGYLLVVFLIW